MATSAVDDVAAALRNCISGDSAAREAGESRLQQLRSQPGHAQALLHLILSGDRDCPGSAEDTAVRQLASISFKNLVARSWTQSLSSAGAAPPLQIHPEDKTAVRGTLLAGIPIAPPPLRSQLVEALKDIVASDYPQDWPDLLPVAENMLSSGDTATAIAALYALRLIARKFEFKSEEEREDPITQLVSRTFPVLVGALGQLVTIQTDDEEMAELAKLVCKTFWSVTYLDLPQPLIGTDGGPMVPWFEGMLALAAKPVPQDSLKWWKAKKWALQALNRMNMQYGVANPKELRSAATLPVAQIFVSRFENQLIELSLKNLHESTVGQTYLSKRCTNLFLQILVHTVSRKASYIKISSFLDDLLFKVVFPLLCWNEEDEALWNDDPQEFVRKGYDVLEDLYSPRTAASNLLREIVGGKRGRERLDRLLAFIDQILSKATMESALSDPALVVNLDGALLALGGVSQLLASKKKYSNLIEPLIRRYLIPLLGAHRGHIRAKAVWLLGNFTQVQEYFEDLNTFANGMRGSIALLTDSDLPVRVNATMSLQYFILKSDDLSIIRPILPSLIDNLFQIMGEVEADDLVHTIEAIAEKFDEEMAPYAIQTMSKLVEVFWSALEGNGEDDDDDGFGPGALAAMNCLRAMSTVLYSVSSVPSLFPQMEGILYPVLARMLTSEGQDVFQDSTEILAALTYYSPAISPQLWTLWPILVQSLREWALDHMTNALIPMDNFISRSTQVFLAGSMRANVPPPPPGTVVRGVTVEPSQNVDVNYQQDVFDVVEQALNSHDMMEEDIRSAPQLLIVVLHHCRHPDSGGQGGGTVDHWIKPYMEICLRSLLGDRTNCTYSFQTLLSLCVLNCVYYCPSLTMRIFQELSQSGTVASEFFHAFFKMIFQKSKGGAPLYFVREIEKKTAALALLSLLHVDTSLLPQIIADNLNQVMQCVMKLLEDLKVQIEKREAKDEDDYDYEDGDEEKESDGENDDDDDDDDNGGDIALRKMRRRTAQALADEEELTDEDEADLEEQYLSLGIDLDADDELVSSPIDDVDAFVFFRETLSALEAQHPEMIARITTGWSTEQLAYIQNIGEYAAKRQAKIADDKAKR